MKILLLSASAATLLTTMSFGVAHAQTEEAQTPMPAANTTATDPMSADRSAMAQECMNDLQALQQRMREEGYWLAGWRGVGYGYGTMPGTTMAPVAPVAGAGGVADPATGTTTATAAQDPAVNTPAGVGPWGNVAWQTRPSMELRALYQAANVLGRRGNQEGCQQVVDAADTIYQDYSQQLKDLGVDPNEVAGWRQQQIATARPVSEMGAAVRTDNVIGTDVRNAQDESLGEVNDIVVDPRSGQIRYAVIAEGGFWGIGQEQVMVPWNQLRATPGMETMILPVSQDALDQAPAYDPANPQGADDQQIQDYWTTALGEQSL